MPPPCLRPAPPQECPLLPAGSCAIGAGAFGQVFKLPCGQDESPKVWKLSELCGVRDVEQAVWEAGLAGMVQAQPGLNLPSETWATWTCPKDLGFLCAEGDDSERPRMMLCQELSFVQGQTLGKKCTKVSREAKHMDVTIL